MEQTTLDLLPAERVEATDAQVPLAQLPGNLELIGPDPTPALVQSVEHLGVITPVVLVRWQEAVYRNEDGKALSQPMDRYNVIAGRRRIKAARLAGLETVPARVYPDEWAAEGLLSLTDHATRKPNAAQELADILDLMARGAGEKDIAQATGTTVARIRAVMKLDGLNEGLKDLLAAGRIAESTAAQAARLPSTVQEALAERYAENGALTARDVQDVRIEVNKAALTATMEAAMGAVDPAADPAVSAAPAAGPFAQVQRMGEKMIAVLEDAERPDLVEGLMRWLKKVQKAQEATR